MGRFGNFILVVKLIPIRLCKHLKSSCTEVADLLNWKTRKTIHDKLKAKDILGIKVPSLKLLMNMVLMLRCKKFNTRVLLSTPAAVATPWAIAVCCIWSIVQYYLNLH
jgi:hypothetical protein